MSKWILYRLDNYKIETMKPINHALISNYHEGMKRKQLTPEDFRKLYNRIIADYQLEAYANSRNADVVCIRQAIMKIARARTTLSLKQIGSIWGKDHTTVIHALKRVANAYDTNDDIYLDWESEVYRYF
jgi:chromosomal replication initiation ATPase DnaA